MGYNYLRLVLKHIIPKSHESIEVVRKMRQVGQQAFAFSNEVKWNLLETKPILKEAFPGLSEDPFDKFGLRAEETAKEIKPIPITSSVLIADAFNEKAEIIKRKKEKESEER